MEGKRAFGRFFNRCESNLWVRDWVCHAWRPSVHRGNRAEFFERNFDFFERSGHRGLGFLCGIFGASQYVGEDGGWRTMFLTSVPLAVVTLVGAGFILPDSPRWLASKNMDSFPALKKLRGPNVSEVELMSELDEINMFADVRRKEEMGKPRSPFAILDKKYAKALYVGLSVVLFQQFTGQPSVLYYATQTRSKRLGGQHKARPILLS